MAIPVLLAALARPGGGIELDWARIIDSETASFPPLYTTIDLGLTFASFEYYNWSALALGVGIHYRF